MEWVWDGVGVGWSGCEMEWVWDGVGGDGVGVGWSRCGCGMEWVWDRECGMECVEWSVCEM